MRKRILLPQDFEAGEKICIHSVPEFTTNNRSANPDHEVNFDEFLEDFQDQFSSLQEKFDDLLGIAKIKAEKEGF
jgi:hypothetical protein